MGNQPSQASKQVSASNSQNENKQNNNNNNGKIPNQNGKNQSSQQQQQQQADNNSEENSNDNHENEEINDNENNNNSNNNNNNNNNDNDENNNNDNNNNNNNNNEDIDYQGQQLISVGGQTKLEPINDKEEENYGFPMNKKLSVNDFTFLKVVGKGSFGKVMQVRKNDDGQIYAMKVLKKKALVKRKQVVHTQTERRVLSQIENPFIVSLRFAFQNEAKLYMVLDYFNGGELFFHLKREGRFSEKRSKFYAAEICSALECLHSKGIIYRDLKPENILLDYEGHIKLTDFGLSKDSLKGEMITHTFCGTPEYLAPEVLQQQGHGKAVDWWSFGTLLYEMMTGLPPFYNQNLNIMYERILHAPIPLPKYLSKEARSIFLGLLERDPKRRLGSSEKDALEIREHSFFSSLDWIALNKKEIEPPFKPKVENEEDTQNVEDEFINETPKDTPVIVSGSMLAAKDMFDGFTYDGAKEKKALQNNDDD